MMSVKSVLLHEGIDLMSEMLKYLKKTKKHLGTDGTPADPKLFSEEMKEADENFRIAQWRLDEVGIIAELLGVCEYRQNFQQEIDRYFEAAAEVKKMMGD
jgi:hypothetical protein